MSWLPTPSTHWIPYELLALCVLVGICALLLLGVFAALLDVTNNLTSLTGTTVLGFQETTNRLVRLEDLDRHLSSIEEHVESLREAQDCREIEEDLRR